MSPEARAGKEREQVRVVARWRARPGRAQALETCLAALIEPTRGEAGCLRYELWRDRADPHAFTFVEEWTDDAALDAHLRSEHVLRALGEAPVLTAGPVEVGRYGIVEPASCRG